MSNEGKGTVIRKVKGILGNVPDVKRQGTRVSKKRCYCFGPFKEIKTKETPLDLAGGITVDLSVA